MPFRDVIARHGHRRIVQLLARSVSGGTLPQSLIFAGPSGSGTRLTASGLAQVLNCLATESRPENSLEIDACGRCTACARVARGVHPDVLVVEPGESGAIRVDQVREIVERAAFRPFEGRRRVVIVDDADRLVPAAQNALLKTLEEPSPSSVFVLVTSRPDVLLPTVRSRCIQLRFVQTVRAEVDVAARDVAGRVLARAGRADTALDAAKELLSNTGAGGAADREQVSSHLRAMAALLRDVAILSTHADPDVLANADVRSALDALVPTYGGDRGVRAFGAVDRALLALEANAGVKVVADWLVLQL
jgi:DNA polymerase-3 subunit delta'